MSVKSAKEALRILKEKHLKKWGVPFGQRKCNFEISNYCFGTAPEYDKDGVLQWKGKMCKACVKLKLRLLHDKRIEARGGLMKRGRPVGSKNKPKKSESDAE